MLKRLIAASITHPSLVIVLAGLFLAGAGMVLARLPVDVFPELNAPTVVVLTEAGGLGSHEVEERVTTRVEAAVGGLPGIRRTRSASALGLSIVWAEFDWGFDVFRARTLVSERLAAVREQLPEGSHAEIGPITSITGEIMLIALSSPGATVTRRELRALGEFELRNALLSVPGVAQVVAIGGELPEYQVLARQDDLLLAGLSLDEVRAATAQAHGVRSAGYLPNVQGEELTIRQRAALANVEGLAESPIDTRDGASVPIRTVAETRLGGVPPRGAAADRGEAAVVLSIQKAPGTNTLELTRAVDAALDAFEATLPVGVMLNRHGFRQANFIQRSVDNLVAVLRDAAVAVALIVILFLLSARTTLITLTALPLSLALAFVVLDLLGQTLNTMTLGGLAVAIGELVDDAIIDVENVVRRLRENALLEPNQRKGTLRVMYEASNEIRGSVVFATVIIAVVFVPMLFLEGLEGRFFRPLGIAYIASILASLVVALTVTPALCALLLKKFGTQTHAEGPLVRWLKRGYDPVLRAALRFRKSLIVVTAAAAGASLWLISTFGTSFLPEFNEGTYTVFVMAPAGTSLPESDRAANAIEKQLVALPGVTNVVRRTGRAERDEHAEPIFNSEIEVTVDAAADRHAVRREIDCVLASVSGIATTIGQPIEHRLSHVMSGTPAAIAISVYGADLDMLRRLAQRIETALRGLSAVRDVAANREARIPALVVGYRDADLARLGLTRASAAEQVGLALDGATVAMIQEGPRSTGLTVRLHPDDRQTPDDVRGLVLRGAQGQLVRLHEVADLSADETPNVIAHEGGRRKAVISCNVAEGHDLGTAVGLVRAQVDPIVRDAGYSVTYGGQLEAQESAARTLLLFGGLAGLLVLLLLQSALGSLRAALLVMGNLPFALIGGVVAILLTTPVVSVASLVGFVTLAGIAIRNGILLVNHYAYLQEHDGRSVFDAVLQGSRERLIPILMTALTAVLGLVPLVLAAGEPGSELLAPLATVVLGGLVSSTLLNAIVVPAGYLAVFGAAGFRRKSLEALEVSNLEAGT